MTFSIPYKKIALENQRVYPEIQPKLSELVEQGAFILRPIVSEFEEELADWCNVKHCIGVNSGSDAIYFLLETLNLKKGDEVIVPSFTFISTISAIVRTGATPVLIDINEDFNLNEDEIEDLISEKTKAIVCVHLNGRFCNMKTIEKIARDHGLEIIEDGCQSLGAKYNGKSIGSFGLGSALSFHPLKILSAWGDGGAVLTNEDKVAERVRLMRCHGEIDKTEYAEFGCNSRLDTLQALVLKYKLPNVDMMIAKCRMLASQYTKLLENNSLGIKLPFGDDENRFCTFANYMIFCKDRDRLNQHLHEQGIESLIHWPTPLHKQKNLNFDRNYNLAMTENACRESLALPMSFLMSESEVEKVVEVILACEF